MLDLKESEELLKKELNYQDFFKDKNMSKAWNAYKKFAKYKFECDYDILHWETYVTEKDGKQLFCCSIVRNFYDEQSILSYVGLYLYFELNSCLLELEDFCDSPEFFEDVEKRDSFNIPCSQFIPLSCEIEYEEL